jgi:hypothetical protein
MRAITLVTFIFMFLHSCGLNAQTAIKATPKEWTAFNGKATFDEGVIHLMNTANKTVLLWLNNTNFKNGIIELDIKGKDDSEGSFVGLAFHGSDNEKYDAVYFRPHNFRNPEKKDHAVQYIDMPGSDWDVLREKNPGKYEQPVHPVPDPNDWFHAKIVINYPAIKVYVNGSEEPTLEVEQISKREEGKLGLWLDSKDGWFKNVVVTRFK